MMPRARMWRLPSGALVALAIGAAPADAQTPVARRDSGRVYRLQVQRSGDTVYVRNLRVTRQQLQERLDSLQHEFEGLGLDAPDRVDLVRELRTIISSLGDISQLEQHARMRLADSALRVKMRTFVAPQVFAMPFIRRSMPSLQPGWIGITAEAPHQRIVRNDSAFIRYFNYPEVVSVEPNSPAERVGIARGDRLLAYDGADLRDREINLTRFLQPSRRITITVRRDGEERDFSLIVTRPPPQVESRRNLTFPDISVDSTPRLRRLPRVGQLAPTPPGTMMILGDPGSVPMAGATLIAIKDESLGHIFGVSGGVLVADVFSDPAESSGLKGGDVIRRADGDEVNDVGQLRRIIEAHNGDRAVELEIVRQKRTRSITLRW
jgi:C-terminal processing protease CtpA/Prc